MPLSPGKSNIGKNITELKEHGSKPRPMKQILAIALHTALDRSNKKRKQKVTERK